MLRHHGPAAPSKPLQPVLARVEPRRHLLKHSDEGQHSKHCNRRAKEFEAPVWTVLLVPACAQPGVAANRSCCRHRLQDKALARLLPERGAPAMAALPPEAASSTWLTI